MSLLDRVNSIDRERLQYRATHGSPFGKANPIIVYQVAHGLHFGDPLALSGSTYSKATNAFQVVVGMVWRVIDADHFIYVGAGGVVNGFSGLTPGSVDGFSDYGVKPDWYESGSSQIGNYSVYAVAISATEKIILNNYIVVRGVLSQSLNCQVITSNAITDIGKVVGPYTLPALPNAALRSTSIVTGIVVDYLGTNYLGTSMWLVISAGSWAVKVTSSHPLYLAGNGVKYLSDTVAGAWTTTEPNISVPIFTSSAYTHTDYPVPSSPPSYYVAIYPLIGAGYGAGIASLASGGTGRDFTAININAVVFKYDATTLGGTLNAGALGVLTQVSAGQPIWNMLDTNTFKQVGANLYGQICGKDIDNGAPADEYLLKYVFSTGKWTAWKALTGFGHIMSYDTGTGKYTEVDASLSTSVLGVPAATSQIPSAIQATADNLVLGRRGGVLTFAKVARAELADGSACSVIGRSANSSGVVADIAAASDGQVLQRISGVLQFAALSSIPTGSTSSGLTTGTWTVPAGVTKLALVVIGGGGGASLTSAQGDNVYVAPSSGGSPTRNLAISAESGAGGSGGMVVAFIKITPGTVITTSIGAGGTQGNAGNNTTLSWTDGGAKSITARGGGLGGAAQKSAGSYLWPGVGGSGGTVSWSLGSGDVAFGFTGEDGESGGCGFSGTASHLSSAGYDNNNNGHGGYGSQPGGDGMVSVVY